MLYITKFFVESAGLEWLYISDGNKLMTNMGLGFWILALFFSIVIVNKCLKQVRLYLGKTPLAMESLYIVWTCSRESFNILGFSFFFILLDLPGNS